jgi:hypothetical protein
MLSKRSKQVSSRSTYSAIPVVVAVSLTFSERAILSDIGQTGKRIVAVVIFGKAYSDTTRYILSTSSLITSKISLENRKREAEK